MFNWIKWLIAGKELAELERIKGTIIYHDRWFAEFDDIKLILDNILYENRDISVLRDKVRKLREKK